METIIDRLFKSGLITTILGVVVFIVAIVMWVMGTREMEEIVLIAGYGFMFLRSKDSLIGIPEKK